MQPNIILNTDSYKPSHWLQYPPGTTQIYCYVESRGGEFDDTLFFGLQAFLLQYLETQVTGYDIEAADEIFQLHGVPFHREGWRHIVERHGGRLPVSIRAVPEGTLVPVKNILLSIENTDPACFWLPTYLETALLRAVWYPTTVATVSFHAKEIIAHWIAATSTLPAADQAALLPFKLHDFGGRGVSSEESAALGGMAHLVNFQGSDTLSGILAARNYYGARMAAFSIPAAEHSTIIAWGRGGEEAAYKNLVERFLGPGRILACVSDSYDLDHAIRNIWGGAELKERVASSGGVLVIRPDSGHPPTVVRHTLDQLGEVFGSEPNTKGYRVLPAYLRVIQGDGVNPAMIDRILQVCAEGGWAAENLAFGMGGALLQKVDRDTCEFAMKCSHAVVGGQNRAVWKAPVMAPEKASKAGRLMLARDAAGAFVTRPLPDGALTAPDDALIEIYRDGRLLIETDFDEVRTRAAGFLAQPPTATGEDR